MLKRQYFALLYQLPGRAANIVGELASISPFRSRIIRCYGKVFKPMGSPGNRFKETRLIPCQLAHPPERLDQPPRQLRRETTERIHDIDRFQVPLSSVYAVRPERSTVSRTFAVVGFPCRIQK